MVYEKINAKKNIEGIFGYAKSVLLFRFTVEIRRENIEKKSEIRAGKRLFEGSTDAGRVIWFILLNNKHKKLSSALFNVVSKEYLKDDYPIIDRIFQDETFIHNKYSCSLSAKTVQHNGESFS